MSLNKIQFRKYALQQRKEIQNKTEKDNIITQTLQSLDIYKQAQKIFSYASFGSEVCTYTLNQAILKDKILALPCTVDTDMSFYQIIDIHKDLALGNYGISEPMRHCRAIDTPDIIIIPGVAFSKDGDRLGYGKGYYDKFLEHTDVVKIALAYDLQIFKSIPTSINDVKMDIIITDKQIISTQA